MAQLEIRDKNYRPNQYINPMLISQKKEPAMGYGPYKIFDKNNPEHPDYKADDDDDEDMQLSLPLDYVKNKRNQNMTIASIRPDQVRAILSTGMLIGPRNEVYGRNREGVWTPQGKFDNKIHGNIVPRNLFSQANNPMMIAKRKKKKNDELSIYEEAARRDAFRDMEGTLYDPDEGRMGGGFDIMDDLLDGV